MLLDIRVVGGKHVDADRSQLFVIFLCPGRKSAFCHSEASEAQGTDVAQAGVHRFRRLVLPVIHDGHLEFDPVHSMDHDRRYLWNGARRHELFYGARVCHLVSASLVAAD